MHIDVHSHFFNTRYLPIAGVARSRGIPAALARLIAMGIRAATPDDDSLEHDGSWFLRKPIVSDFALARNQDPQPLELTPEQAIDRFTRTAPQWLIASPEFDEVVREAAGVPGAMALEPTKPIQGDIGRRDWLNRYLQTDKNLLLETTGAATFNEDTGEVGVGGYLAFLYNLTSREKTLADHHQKNCPGVGLFVHLMMDMEWPYHDKPDYDYPRAIRRVRHLCRQSGGRIVPFVAFDAYRPNGYELTADALLHQSFVGMKFYAPSGYRPDHNAEAVRSRKDVQPVELDRRCAQMIEFCAKHDIPIMAHCTPQGMEAVPKKHSGFNADPEFWRNQLKAHPTLRLCFAHAGGHGHWFTGEPPEADRPPHYPWATSIIDLCTHFANVYADLAHLGEILDDGVADSFAKVLATDMLATDKAPFPLRKKVMYGTDYPMPLPLGGWGEYYEKLLKCVQRNETLRVAEDDLFRESAKSFLNLPKFIQSRGSDLTEEQVRYLMAFA